MTYTPQAGTIAARVIELLARQSAGHSLTTHQVLEKLKMPLDTPLSSVMKRPLAAGMVKRERLPHTRLWLWSIGGAA